MSSRESRPADLLATGTTSLGLSLDTRQQESLLAFVALMQKWNKVYNLTAIRDSQQMISHHLLDSLSIVPFVSGVTVLDVGSGPGLPGIPLAIARPDLSVTMLDSNSKKTAFVRQAIMELGLRNAEVVTQRVESWQAPQRFELIVSRAFAELSDFVTQAGHLLAQGGIFMAMKGQYPKEEIDRLPSPFQVKGIEKLEVFQLGAERHLVFVEAVR